jgi:hypothetical protein
MITKARPDWQSIVSERLTRVQKLVHLAVRADSVYVDSVRSELARARRRAYNDELSIQARRAGCNRQGNGSPAELDRLSTEDAEAFANQYNTDLAAEIIRIRADSPEWTEGTARSLAQEHFHKNNRLDGTAVLEPSTATCPICQGWINRGEVPLRVALNNPPPYHFRCPHIFLTYPERIDDCADLWMG